VSRVPSIGETGEHARTHVSLKSRGSADDAEDEGSSTMNDEATRAVAPIDTKKVRPVSGTVPQPQHERAETQEPFAKPVPPPEAEGPPPPALSAAGHRTTDLAYQVDAESKRVSVQVVDRETGAVVRSFPLFVPGQGESIDGEGAGDDGESDAPRGTIVDAKV
jgi:hypothetical protein